MLRDLQLALIRVEILHWASQEPVYGVQMLEELAERGHPIGAGTLYPMLHQLESEGLLTRENRLSDGRIRKYYVATGEAQAELRRAAGWLETTQVQLQPHRSLDDPLVKTADRAGSVGHPQRRPGTLMISVRELHAWQMVPIEVRPAIVDVRTRDEYISGHIPRAGNVPVEQLPQALGRISANQPVVTCCTMHHRGSSRSERAAHLLNDHGYRAWVLDGGIPAWSAASLPLVSGAVEE